MWTSRRLILVLVLAALRVAVMPVLVVVARGLEIGVKGWVFHQRGGNCFRDFGRDILRNVTQDMLGILFELAAHLVAVLHDFVVQLIQFVLQVGDNAACLVHGLGLSGLI